MYYTLDGVRDIVRASQVGNTSWESLDSVPGLPADLLQFLKAMNAFILDFENGWKQPFSDYSNRIGTIQDDLHVLNTSCESISLSLGTPVEIDDLNFPDAWNAIGYAAHCFTTSPEFVSINAKLTAHQHTIEQMPQMSQELQALHADMVAVMDTLDKFENRFVAIQPILQSVWTLQKTITNLSQTLPTAPTTMRSSPTSPFTRPVTPDRQTQFIPITPTPSPDPDSVIRLNTIEEKLKHLENRVVGDGVTIRHFVFQSLDDVRIWCAKNLKTNRFGLFLDGVSIFEFLAQDHADATEVLTNLYNSQKNQFNNMYDSKVMTSCQNLFPTLFGRLSADGLDTSRTLPGLSTHDKWDNNGVTGLRFQIAREIINVDTQISNAIMVAFRDAPDAATLAKELLYRSKKFVNDLSNFISQDFAFWQAKGYAAKGLWELTCCSVRRLYEDIHQVRIIARDVRDLDDLVSTTSLILWATLRTHVIMEDYTRRNFYEHPSISAVIACHLAANHTKPDDSLEARMRKMEEKMVEQRRRLDSIESRLARVEQKNEISPPKPGRGRLHKNQTLGQQDDS